MPSVRLFRYDNAVRLFRPLWDSCRAHKCSTNALTGKKEKCQKEKSEADPYEGNFSFRECDHFIKVTVIGAAGRVGRNLSLLLKTCPFVDHVCLFDTDKSVKGISTDISHIDTKCRVDYFCGMKNIQKALDAPDVVVIAAGCPTSPDLQEKKLFKKNAPIVAGLSEACARFCPKACIVLVTSPINSLLPVVGEIFQLVTNHIPHRKLFGLTTLDVVRANTFVAEVVRMDPNNVIVPVIGGTSQDTIVPVISQMKPCCKIKLGEMIALTECVKRAEGNLSDCQNCGTPGASSLSTAYAAFRFTSSLVMALKGAENIIECAFVKSNVIPELEYMASPLQLGRKGIEHNFGYPPLAEYEVNLMEQAAAALKVDIEMGKSFVTPDRKNEKDFYRRCSWGHCNSYLDTFQLPPDCSSQSIKEEKTEVTEPEPCERGDKHKPSLIEALVKKEGKGASKETLKEMPKETPKEALKEMPKETPKEALKETPKEMLKETPEETPKEMLKETPREMLKETLNETPKETLCESVKGTSKETLKEAPRETLCESVKGTSKETLKEAPKKPAKETVQEPPSKYKAPFQIQIVLNENEFCSSNGKETSKVVVVDGDKKKDFFLDTRWIANSENSECKKVQIKAKKECSKRKSSCKGSKVGDKSKNSMKNDAVEEFTCRRMWESKRAKNH